MIATGLGFHQHFAIARDPQFSLARIDFGSGPARACGPRFCFLRKRIFPYEQLVEILKEISVRLNCP